MNDAGETIRKASSADSASFVSRNGRLPIPADAGDESYIFVSYSPADSERVFAEIKWFKEAGYHVRYAERFVSQYKISDAIERCSLFVVFLTNSSIGSRDVMSELNFAIEKNIPVIRIYLEPCEENVGLRLSLSSSSTFMNYLMDEEEYLYKIKNTFDSASPNLRAHRQPMQNLDNVQPKEVPASINKKEIKNKRRLHNKRDKQTGIVSAKSLQTVQFSAIAPKVLVKGDYSIIHVIMYEEEYRHIVKELIKEQDEPVQEVRSGVHKVSKGTEIQIILNSPDIVIEDNIETGIWQGKHLDFSFAVLLRDNYPKRQILLTASVFMDGVIVTRLKFVVKCSSLLKQKLNVSREDVLSAFVSYASQDRTRVASIVQGMKKVRQDLDVFFDVDNLRSGEDWEQTLRTEIEQRDVLYLFWSHYAQESEWVNKEWRYALKMKGIECIEPVPIEPPSSCPPPEELKQKHFNDKLLYIINS